MPNRKKLKKLIGHLLLILLGVSFFFPFYWLLSTSVKSEFDVFKMPPVWLPKPLFQNYPQALHYIPFFKYMKNTFIVCALSVLGMVLSCSFVAYGFARIRWVGRNAVFFLVLSTLMLPAQVTLIPLFEVFKFLGWINTFKPLIVPAFFGSAFFIFLLRQFFLTIPEELSEAARIDGCGELRIYARIIMPLSKPALATVALFTFIAAWNDFLGPLIYLNDDNKYTLAVGLQHFVSLHDTKWALLMAASTVMTLPIIVLFFLTQRTFIKGIALTGIKG
jgi:multiple sugar transport system permease protein